MRFAVASAFALATLAAPPLFQAGRPPAVPFAVGETLTYDVSWSSVLMAGTAVATVKDEVGRGLTQVVNHRFQRGEIAVNVGDDDDTHG